MAKKPKTRVLAIMNGARITLFTVKEVKSGDLIISINKAFASLHTLGSNRPYKEGHFTVHKSNEGNDTCLSHETIYGNGDIEKTVSLIKNTKDFLLFPVFFRVEGGPPRQEPFNIRDKDKNVYVGNYFNLTTSICYSVFVTNLKEDLGIKCDDFNFYDLKFGYFRLLIFVSYCDITSTVPFMVTYRGSSVRLNNEPVNFDERKVLSSIRGMEMLRLHYKHSQEMLCESYKIISSDKDMMSLDREFISRVVKDRLLVKESRFYVSDRKKR
ncbi:hypothetical protein [Roseibium suaedae]|uniref:Uncharacterized protein n=1 Tax=Roseibium suaedae TaxID=735517 RepID=A0A1M7PME0_9HYPH|nr:hypothetical protein [Roseibium suaedae]SHN18356.1 hypothetical protein SAMN05444272_4507 [Roseibium suaedae]